MLITIFSRTVKFIAAVIFLVAFNCADANASIFNIVSVQSIDIKPYNDAVRGYEDACNCEIKKLVLSELRGNIIHKVRRSKPDIIIAVGMTAVKSIMEIEDIPIIHLMAPLPETLLKDRKNIVGIEMFIPHDKQLAAIKETLPHIRTVGIIYSTGQTESFVKNAIRASRSLGITIVAKKVNNAKEFPGVLESMKGNIDVYWMLPDIHLVTPETNEYAFLFSIENNIPVVTFSDKYLEMGALVSLDVDAYNIGRQAWELSDRILICTDISSLDKVYAEKINIELNTKVANIFGVVPIGKKLIKAFAVKEDYQAF